MGDIKMYNPQGVVKKIREVTQVIGVKRKALNKFFCFKKVKVCRKIKKQIQAAGKNFFI